jgi:hypothetical protein
VATIAALSGGPSPAASRIAPISRKYSIGNSAGVVTVRIDTSSSLRAKNPWTEPRGMKTTSPGPTSWALPSIVNVSTPRRP